MIIIFIVLWYLVGACGFIYWWTKDYCLYNSDIPFMLFASIMGPVTFIIGWGIHSENGEDKVLFKKRR